MADDVNSTIRNPKPSRLVVGISGASGVVYGARVLDALRELGVESHLVVTKAALLTLSQETDLTADALTAKASVTHRLADVGAAIASGSFRTMGMIVAPCSVRTMSEIATGVTSTLLTRAADVTLKERRQLILVPREAPYSSIHLEHMLKLSNMGVTILPASPGFYHQPQTIDDLVDFVVARILNLLNIPQDMLPRWGEHHLGGDE